MKNGHRPRHGGLRQAGYLMEAVSALGAACALYFLPRRYYAPVSRAAGYLVYRLDRRDRNRAFANLEIVSAGVKLAPSEKRAVVRHLFRHMVRLALEFLQLGALRQEDLPRLFRVEGLENVHRALGKGKGVLVLSAHLGNWELMGAAAARLGYPVATVIRRQHNPYMDRWMRRWRETKGGVRCLYDTPGLLSRIGAHLKSNGILALLVDQAFLSKPLYVPFFGIPCPTADGPAKLHLWFGSPIITAVCLQQRDAHYLLQFSKPYSFTPQGDLQRDCQEIMAWLHQRLEEIIRRHPEQWFSMLTPRWRQGEPRA